MDGKVSTCLYEDLFSADPGHCHAMMTTTTATATTHAHLVNECFEEHLRQYRKSHTATIIEEVREECGGGLVHGGLDKTNGWGREKSVGFGSSLY